VAIPFQKMFDYFKAKMDQADTWLGKPVNDHINGLNEKLNEGYIDQVQFSKGVTEWNMVTDEVTTKHDVIGSQGMIGAEGVQGTVGFQGACTLTGAPLIGAEGVQGTVGFQGACTLTGAPLHFLTEKPGDPAIGDTYFETSNQSYRVFDGSDWITIATANSDPGSIYSVSPGTYNAINGTIPVVPKKPEPKIQRLPFGESTRKIEI